MPVESDGISKPGRKRLPTWQSDTLVQNHHPPAPLFERIVTADVLIAAIARDAQAHIQPAIGTHGEATAAVAPGTRQLGDRSGLVCKRAGRWIATDGEHSIGAGDEQLGVSHCGTVRIAADVGQRLRFGVGGRQTIDETGFGADEQLVASSKGHQPRLTQAIGEQFELEAAGNAYDHCLAVNNQPLLVILER